MGYGLHQKEGQGLFTELRRRGVGHDSGVGGEGECGGIILGLLCEHACCEVKQVGNLLV